LLDEQATSLDEYLWHHCAYDTSKPPILLGMTV
jgi:hypothetical protein